MSVGANRIVPGVSIPHPVGRPDLSEEDELNARKDIVKTALMALATEIEGQTLFPVL